MLFSLTTLVSGAQAVVNSVFDTVADMKAATIADKSYVVTKGYYSPGDGGHAQYIIEADPGNDDGGSVINFDNRKQHARLIHDGTVNVRQFGAHGKGNSNQDDSQPIMKAIEAQGVSKIIIPRGTYRIWYTIYLNEADNPGTFNNKHILGEEGSIIRWEDNHDFTKACPNGIKAHQMLRARGCRNLIIENLHLDGYRYKLNDLSKLPKKKWAREEEAAKWEEGGGIWVSSYNVRIKNCIIRDTWGGGISCPFGSKNVVIENCTVIRPRQSAYACTNSRNIKIINSTAYVCHNAFIDVEPNPGETAKDCIFIGNTYYNDDRGLPDDLKISSRDIPSNAKIFWYYSPTSDNNFQGNCTALQCSAHYITFEVDSKFEVDLKTSKLSKCFRDKLENNKEKKFKLSKAVEIITVDKGVKWHLSDRGETHLIITKDDGVLYVYYTGLAKAIKFLGNTVHQSGKSSLISIAGEDVTIDNNSFYITEPQERMVTFGSALEVRSINSTLSNNQFIGQAYHAKTIKQFIFGNSQDNIRITNNHFVNVSGSLNIHNYRKVVHFGDNTWTAASPNFGGQTAFSINKHPAGDGDLFFTNNYIDVKRADIGLRLASNGNIYVENVNFNGATSKNISIIAGKPSIILNGLISPSSDLLLYGISSGPGKSKVNVSNSIVGYCWFKIPPPPPVTVVSQDDRLQTTILPVPLMPAAFLHVELRNTVTNSFVRFDGEGYKKVVLDDVICEDIVRAYMGDGALIINNSNIDKGIELHYSKSPTILKVYGSRLERLWIKDCISTASCDLLIFDGNELKGLGGSNGIWLKGLDVRDVIVRDNVFENFAIAVANGESKINKTSPRIQLIHNTLRSVDTYILGGNSIFRIHP